MTVLGGRGLFFDTVALQSAQAVNLALGFATFSILGNALSKPEYGAFSLVLSLVNYLFVATASWNGQGFVRFGREEFVRTRRLARSFAARAVLIAIAGLVCAAALTWGRGSLTQFVGLDPRWWWFFLGLLALRLVSDAISTTLQVTGDFRLLALYQVGDKALFLAALLGAWGLARGLSAPSVLAALVLGKLAAIVLAAPRLRVSWLRPVGPLRGSLRELWRYSGPLLASSAFGYLPLVAGPYILNYNLDTAEVARYNVAYQVYGFYQALTTTVLGTVLIPVLTDMVTAGRDDRAGRLVGRFAGQLALVNAVAVALLSAAAMVAFPLLLPLYVDSVPVVVLLLAGTSWQVMVTVYSAMLAALKTSRPVAVVNAVGGVVFTALNWLVIPLGGVMALAATWTAWYPVSAVAYLVSIRRRADMGPLRDLLPPTVALASGVAVAAFAEEPSLGLPVALLAPAGALLLARKARWFRREDLAHLERLSLPPSARRLARAFYRAMDPAGPDARTSTELLP